MIVGAERDYGRRWTALPMAIGLLALGLVGGCQQGRETLGLSKRQPDEFTVVTRAPLIVPPDVNLRPPLPGAPRPQEARPSELAAEALFDQPAAAVPSNASRAELALLSKSGASRADPAIREVLWREAATNAELDASFVDTLLFWREPVPATIEVDATAEAARLRKNAAEGKAPSEGESPVVIRRQRALLEGIF